MPRELLAGRVPQLLAPGLTARVETGLNTCLTYGSADLEPGSCLLDYRRCEFTDARPSMILVRLAMTVSNEGRRAQPPTLRPLVSVQTAVNYYNAGHKVLTRMFAVEDSHWCASMIPGIEVSGIPLPLGGTSNHLRSAQLSELDGWDPWNVTGALTWGYATVCVDSDWGSSTRPRGCKPVPRSQRGSKVIWLRPP